MKIIEDPQEYTPLAKEVIKKFGYAPEHNLEWFFCATEPYQQPIFVSWPDSSGLLTQKEKGAWYVFVGPIVPKDKISERLIEFCNYALAQPDIKKISLELRTDERKVFLRALRKTDLKSLAINYTLTWPVMNMEKFDPNLPGKYFKEIRNARNKFYREHKVEIKKASECSRNELINLIDSWRKVRKAHDRAYYHRYYFLAESGFKCCKTARAMLVDGKLAGLNGGWDVPNADQSFYAAIGLHDYSVKDLGLMLYLEDLSWIKTAGYKTADMGGGEKDLTKFKNQFLPESWYKTCLFSVMKK